MSEHTCTNELWAHCDECEKEAIAKRASDAANDENTIAQLLSDAHLAREAMAAVTEDVAKQRAVIAQMRPVYEAALAWRKGRDRNIVGTAPSGGQRSETGCALIDAVDIALGITPQPPAPADMRSDYLAAHLWCNQHGVKAVIDGKPATLADRVKLIAAENVRLRVQHDVACNGAHAMTSAFDRASAQLARLQPLRNVLRSWNWAEIQKDGVLPRDTPVESQVINAFATVERDENRAAKERALIDAIDATTSPTASKNGAEE